MKGEKLMDFGAQKWEALTRYFMNRPLALIGYSIGIILFLIFLVPSGTPFHNNVFPISTGGAIYQRIIYNNPASIINIDIARKDK